MISAYILNGPNLNLLGHREPDIYGTLTLEAIESSCQAHADRIGMAIESKQSNHEGALIDWIHEADKKSHGVILNAGAYTHTSIALHDAIRSVSIPVIEVHLSNIHARESFRHKSYISPVASGIIVGFGASGYCLALDALHHLITTGNTMG